MHEYDRERHTDLNGDPVPGRVSASSEKTYADSCDDSEPRDANDRVRDTKNVRYLGSSCAESLLTWDFVSWMLSVCRRFGVAVIL